MQTTEKDTNTVILEDSLSSGPSSVAPTTDQFIRNVIREAKAGDTKVFTWDGRERACVAGVTAIIVTQEWLDDVGRYQKERVKVGDRILMIE